MKTLLANMRHAVHNRQITDIGGGTFRPHHLREAVEDIELAREALKTAAELIKTARPRFPKSIRNADTFALNLAAATVSNALNRLDA